MKKLNVLLFLAFVSFNLCPLLSVQAGVPQEIIAGTYGQRIHPDPEWGTMTIIGSEPSYLKHGFPTFQEYLRYELPFKVEVYMDGEKITLQRFVYYDKDGVLNPWGIPDLYVWQFYQIFEPGYFTPGEYEWRIVWSMKGWIDEVTATLVVL